jgi:hypothetical protein
MNFNDSKPYNLIKEYAIVKSKLNVFNNLKNNFGYDIAEFNKNKAILLSFVFASVFCITVAFLTMSYLEDFAQFMLTAIAVVGAILSLVFTGIQLVETVSALNRNSEMSLSLIKRFNKVKSENAKNLLLEQNLLNELIKEKNIVSLAQNIDELSVEESECYYHVFNLYKDKKREKSKIDKDVKNYFKISDFELNTE